MRGCALPEMAMSHEPESGKAEPGNRESTSDAPAAMAFPPDPFSTAAVATVGRETADRDITNVSALVASRITLLPTPDVRADVVNVVPDAAGITKPAPSCNNVALNPAPRPDGIVTLTVLP